MEALGPSRPPSASARRPGRTSVGELCARRIVAVPTSVPLSDVANLMSREHVGAVVVVTDGDPLPRVAGIITDRDIVRAQVERTADLAGLSVAETMTPNPLVLLESDSMDGAIAHLRARGVRRAPVVSQRGTLIGLVSVDDLLAQLASTLIDLAGIVKRQPQRESL